VFLVGKKDARKASSAIQSKEDQSFTITLGTRRSLCRKQRAEAYTHPNAAARMPGRGDAASAMREVRVAKFGRQGAEERFAGRAKQSFWVRREGAHRILSS